ncbi:hypothetical protein [Undibacterium sp. Di24W]|uniref:hypothetical protein n=1 Tax=Undibacterium sp. Di24W TaxID=3413033 RepID=UPI003BF331F3
MAKKVFDKKVEMAAAAKRLGLFDEPSKNVLNINKNRNTVKANVEVKKKKFVARETREVFIDRLHKTYDIKPLQVCSLAKDYDVTNPTRYPAVKNLDAGDIALKNILKRYRYSMEGHCISPADFKNWREYFLLMSCTQLAELIRVNERTIKRWEAGTSAIPFSMWWMMHSTMQDPAYFLTRPGFHDFYIEYVDGEALLCSYKHPEIRCSSTDLYFNRACFNELLIHKNKLKTASQKYDELLAENTRLREMYKANAVAKELELMHQHIGLLMSRIGTADVMEFPGVSHVPVLTNLTQKTA